MASAAAEAEKGSPVVVGLLVVGNIIILLSGLALFAETVWVTADQYRVYPLMGVSGKDDVFAGAWIAIFCGFSFFVVASFGVGAALCRRRSMILTYLVLMLIVYIFECASCITSYTHRDYMVSNPSLITKQMLTFYSADTDQGRELTRLWDRIMIEGCFEHISHAIDSYTWGISWFGFAILMWTVRAACDADGHVFLHHVVRDRKATCTPRPLPPPVPVSSGRGLDGCLSSPLPTSLELPSFLTKDLFPGF
ncbi:uroplakin-1a isoform X3 [Felis catus]|uniref:uroplakin-1a isoform X3 n=1 Tax=Felis catus TaxID=9685 RepID=UPI001D19A2F5|nr:uroplakin-1a isoform X3 [Felis catus]